METPMFRKLLTASALAALLATPAFAADRTLTVSGQGEASGVPDRAVLNAGVLTEAKTASAALAENSRAMNSVFAALKRSGIPDRSIQTSNFNISPQYTPYDGNNPKPQAIIGYQVSNQVTVRIDDVSKVGEGIDALVNSGANQAGGINFTFKNAKPMLAEARTEAVKDAMEKARTYAAAAGITLGSIISIQEGGNDYPRPMAVMAMAREKDQSTPVAAGEQSITANVTVTFSIK